MANKSFNNLDELELYLQKNVYELLFNSMEIERVMAEEMSRAVEDVVYAPYDPEGYDRRAHEGGLSDERNMQITSVYLEGSSIKMKFENLTKGNDSLKGEYIGDLIEFGEGYADKHWSNANGVWATPRGFAEETANRLRENPTELLNALKKALIARGFTVN